MGVDPGVFLDRLRDYERWLFRGIVYSRVAIVAGLGVILPDERSIHGSGVFWLIVAAWAVTFVWVVTPLIWLRSLFRRVRQRPWLVWVDVAMLVVLLLVGGGWRNPFYLYAWSPFGLASVFLSARRTLIVVGVGCAARVGSFLIWDAGGWDPAARHVGLSEWPSPGLAM